VTGILLKLCRGNFNALFSLVYVTLNCFRCDGKGKYRNQFGIWEKCESCQKKEMSFDSATPEPDVNEEGL